MALWLCSDVAMWLHGCVVDNVRGVPLERITLVLKRSKHLILSGRTNPSLFYHSSTEFHWAEDDWKCLGVSCYVFACVGISLLSLLSRLVVSG